mgnify:CR=1 FL=1
MLLRDLLEVIQSDRVIYVHEASLDTIDSSLDPNDLELVRYDGGLFAPIRHWDFYPEGIPLAYEYGSLEVLAVDTTSHTKTHEVSGKPYTTSVINIYVG